MQDLFTRREQIVVVIMLLAFIAVVSFPVILNPDYEFIYLLFVVVPIGWLLATDPERLNKNSPSGGE